MIAGQDRLRRLLYAFIQAGDNDGCVADDPVYTDACISQIMQELPVENKDGKTGGNLDDKTGETIGEHFPKKKQEKKPAV